MLIFYFSVITLAKVALCDAAKILAYFPTPSISHQVVFRPLTQELAKRGHEVLVITADPVFKKGKAPENLTEIDLHDLSYDVAKKEFLSDEFAKGNKKDSVDIHTVAFILMMRVFEKQISSPEVQAILKDKARKFDLVFVEAWSLLTLGITHYYDAPVIQISSFGAYHTDLGTLGLPMHPIVHPTSLGLRIYNLTNWEKITELTNFLRLERAFQDCEEKADKMLKRVIGPDVPSLRELRNNVDMLFLNVHPIWEMNRPSPPNIVYMGGLHQIEVKELPKELKSYLDSSKNGVIYMSFGTNVEPASLPTEKISMLVNVFSRLPYDILWKWNKDELPGRSKNIRISKWLPQSDLLRHPKIKIFITQGGLQSTDESITAGVPLIGIPLMGDQWYNVEQYVFHKIGVHIDMETITEEKIENAIKTIIREESTYRNNLAKLRSLMKDQPQTPLDRAVWWTEYVLRHKGAKHLRSPSANMPWTEYLELKLLSYILLVLLLIVFGIVFVVMSVCKCVMQGKNNAKAKKS